jgi:GNAT superfamily N-acetyltransferase
VPIALRLATPADLADLFWRTRALNAHEGIELDAKTHEAALLAFLGDPSLGAIWLVVREPTVIGYALVSYSYDLEFSGREGWLTELWIDEPARGGGAATAALALLEGELRLRGVKALHLQVRPENPAARLYARLGYTASPRVVMTRRIS